VHKADGFGLNERSGMLRRLEANHPLRDLHARNPQTIR
jgi:hypothetical protein